MCLKRKGELCGQHSEEQLTFTGHYYHNMVAVVGLWTVYVKRNLENLDNTITMVAAMELPAWSADNVENKGK